MKRLLLTGLLALLPCGLSAQDWSANPTEPSLLLFVEGIAGPADLERPAIYTHTGHTIGANLTALLELPASNQSNILLKAGVSHRQDDVLTASVLGRGKLTDWGFSFGFGVRFLLGKKINP